MKYFFSQYPFYNQAVDINEVVWYYIGELHYELQHTHRQFQEAIYDGI